MDSANNERSNHNQETSSEEDFTSFITEDLPLKSLFDESNEENICTTEHNNTQTFVANTESSENSEFKQPSVDKQSAPSEDIEEEPERKPQQLLLWALNKNKFERFSSLLKVPGVDPGFKYGKPHYTTCMELACRLEWGGIFVKALLERGAKPNVHGIHQEPIHYAAKHGNPEALEALLQNKNTKVNVVDSSGRTALHHAVKYSQKGRDAEYERCIELLLKTSDLALNIPNTSGYTAVHEAVNSNKKGVELILKYRKDDVDLDSYKIKGGRTARECILSNYPELSPLLPKYQIKNQELDRQNKLLLALQHRQQEAFNDILCQVDEDGRARVNPDYYYGRPNFATCLEIACRKKDCAEYAKQLLAAGADPNLINPKNNQTALQVAVEMRNIHVLRVLLEDRRTNIYAVHEEVKQVIAELDQQTDNEEIRQDDEEAKKHKDAIHSMKLILSTRSRLGNIHLSLLQQTLFQHLYERKYEDFTNKFSEEYKDINDGNYTLLQYATLQSLESIVQLLLESGADPNATTEREKRQPILIACMKNDHKIMKLLLRSVTNNELDVNVTDPQGNTPLHHVSNTEYLDCVVDLMRCGADMQHKIILNKPPLPANSLTKFLDMSLQTNNKLPGDEEYTISFDYSLLVAHNEKGTKRNPHQEGEQLLTHDQETGVRNVQFPEKMKPELDFLFYMTQKNEHKKLLEHPIITSFLDMKWECLKWYFYINMCMYFLFAVLLNAHILLNIGDSATNGNESMITSNDTKTSQSNSGSTGFHVTWWLILIFLPYFIVKELLQFTLSPNVKKKFLCWTFPVKVYFTNYENFLDLGIIGFSGYILSSSEWHDTFVVITIILSWTEVILLTGRHPKLSRNIEMLKTVSLNYFRFLFSYFFLLIAFAFSFYSLLHKNAANNSMKYHDREGQYFFMDPFMSVMKTYVMMMGEFEAESLAPEMANSRTCFILFALFVFIITMVLLNLLTGLAVSDTQEIKLVAKELSVVSRIRLIYKLESTLLQWYTFVEKWPTKYTILRCFIKFQKSKIKNISLFPDTSYKKRIHVLPNKGLNIVFERNGPSEGEDGHAMQTNGRRWHRYIQNLFNNSSLRCNQNLYNNNLRNPSYNMNLKIIRKATRIISNQSETDVNNMKENFSQIQKEALKEDASKLSKIIENKMEDLFEKYRKKLDGIEGKLKHDQIQSKKKGSQKRKRNATTNHKMETTPPERCSNTEATNQETKAMFSEILKMLQDIKDAHN